MSSEINRRKFMEVGFAGSLGAAISTLNLSGCGGALRGLGSAPYMRFAAPPVDPVRVGDVGVGGTGVETTPASCTLPPEDMSPEASAFATICPEVRGSLPITTHL